MNDREKWRETVRDIRVLVARHDDDDIYIYIYIYIYCRGVWFSLTEDELVWTLLSVMPSQI